MNLHWGKTLQNKWVKVRSRKNRNQTSYYSPFFSYNASEYKVNPYKYYMSDYLGKNNSDRNQTVLHAENQFLKKSRILTDMMDHPVKTQSFTTVIVIGSIFLFLTMTITAAVVVFCRKRNSVFALQKSEQEDLDYEMEEFNTDMEYTETEFESETDSIRPRKSVSSTVAIESDYENSPARRPLVQTWPENEIEDSPLQHHVCRCGADPRGAYQRMVVTAVMEKHSLAANNGSESEDSGNESRTKYLQKLNKKYYGFAAVSSDLDSDYETYPTVTPPTISITYADDPPSYDSLDYLPKQQCNVTVHAEHYETPPDIPQPDNHHNTAASEKSSTMTYQSDSAVVYTDLPLKEKPPLEEAVFVELPPKQSKLPDQEVSVQETSDDSPETEETDSGHSQASSGAESTCTTALISRYPAPLARPGLTQVQHATASTQTDSESELG